MATIAEYVAFGQEMSHPSVVALPDFGEIADRHRAWQLQDRGPRGELERYSRFRDWAHATAGTRSVFLAERERDDLALAVTHLAVAGGRFPDLAVWHALVTVASSRLHPNPFDIALAFACGWSTGGFRRPFVRGSVGDTAVLALVEQVRSSLVASVRMLAEQIGIRIVANDEIPSMAADLGMSLLGSCACGHHVRQCRGCGASCCYSDHDLRNWNPTVCHLRPFIDQAVRGSAQRRILGGAFASGMLFRLLEREGRLMCRTVEWGCCEVCGRTFEGLRCPEPHVSAVGSVRREPRKNQLIVPPVGEAGHVPMQRWWCGSCRHLYGAAARRQRPAPCPRCGRAPTASKAVWTLVPRSARLSEVG